jgi:hypothetical protein
MGLLEVMLAITIATALLSVVGLAISRIFTANTAARQHAHTMNALGQLGARFRQDVHAAVSATLTPTNGTAKQLKLAMTDGVAIEYLIVTEGIERRRFSEGALRAKELFLLEGMQPIAWRVDDDQRDVALTVGRRARPTLDDKTLSGKFTIRAVRRAAGENINP